jgi:hypothetical protein
MIQPRTRRALMSLLMILAILGPWPMPCPPVCAGPRRNEAAQLVPLDQIAPEARASVIEVLSTPTFHRKGAPETFFCHPQIYLSLLGEPTLTLALWKDLNTASPVRLQQVGPDRFIGTDDAGTTATGGFVLRSPRLHVMHGQFECISPRGNARLEGRIVLIVRSDYQARGRGQVVIQQEVEVFVKIDSRGWRTVAKTVRPLVDRFLEDQVREAGWFVSLMGRLVEMYPNWACQVARQGPEIRPEVRQAFQSLVLQNRRPGASTGRPTLADNTSAATRTR